MHLPAAHAQFGGSPGRVIPSTDDEVPTSATPIQWTKIGEQEWRVTCGKPSVTPGARPLDENDAISTAPAKHELSAPPC